jgi:hypothetical protein
MLRTMRASKLAVYARTLTAASVLGVLGVPASATAATVQPPPFPGPNSVSSYPPDQTVYAGESPRFSAKKAAGVFVVDTTQSAGSTGGAEPSIAVNPSNPDQVAITRFGASTWNNNASLLYSTNGGAELDEREQHPAATRRPGHTGMPVRPDHRLRP